MAIIGIIAALLIPNFLDALQKAKQKRTVADMRNTGTAMFSWLTDQVGAAAAGAAATEVDLSKLRAGLDAATRRLRPGAAVPAVGSGARTAGRRTYHYWLEDRPTCCSRR